MRDPDDLMADELRHEDACRREMNRQRLQHWHPRDPERIYEDEEDER